MKKKILFIQFLSLYRAICAFVFILFYRADAIVFNNVLIISAITSDYIDGYLAKKFELQTEGGALLDLFSDKYLNLIAIIFLITENYSLLPLLFVITKEIFVISFRSIKIDDEFIISTNRYIGGCMSGFLYIIVVLHINNLLIFPLNNFIYALGISNFIYLIYKIKRSFNKLKLVFTPKS